jgi:ABC-2 type transport system permease protein
MSDARPIRSSRAPTIWVFLSWRLRQLGNTADQLLRESPLQTLGVAFLLALIWSGLYLLLDIVLRQVGSWELEGAIAQEYIFINFFFILSVMLVFSNAIIAFSAFFGREEAGHLMTMPVLARHVALVKWLEGIALSSWSFLLLGVPLMLAISQQRSVEWHFYPLFIAHFVGFVAIPATIGVIAAWAVAMFAPRSPMTLVLWIGGIALLGVLIWIYRISLVATEADEWLRHIISDLGFSRSIFLPSAWTARGVIALIQRDIHDSLFYLGVVAANACFLTWFAINLVSVSWTEGFSRAQHGRVLTTIREGRLTRTICRVLFGYLPQRLQLIMLKDLRTFARDATQWTQMAIMLGLLVLYAVNLHRLPMNVGQTQMRALVTFGNLMTVSLILATFTSRFVYPLLSLEIQQLWILGLLPVRRFTLLFSKFVFALTITGLASTLVMGLAVNMLNLPLVWAVLNILFCLMICVGLCGLSVGLGARYPVIGQRNPARIASGLGGSFNLVASMVFVALELTGIGYLFVKEVQGSGFGYEISTLSWQIFAGLALLSISVAGAAMMWGARHFSRFEG